MIGNKIDVTTFDREQAYDYILNRCKNCERQLDCTGKESKECNEKVLYLVTKYRK